MDRTQERYRDVGEALLGSTEAARWLGITPQTLRAWRTRGRTHAGAGPTYIRYGGPTGRVVYQLSALRRFLAAHEHVADREQPHAHTAHTRHAADAEEHPGHGAQGAPR